MIRTLTAALVTSTCFVALATPATAQTREYNIPAGSLKSALNAYVRQSGRQVVYRADEVRSARSAGARGQLSAEAALANLLSGSGFTTRVDGNLVAIVKGGNGDTPKAAASSADDSVSEGDEIVVTGTSIRGVQPAGSPLIQIDRKQIANTGLSTTQDVLRTLPQNFSGGAAENTVFSVRDGSEQNVGAGAGVNLRGLGNDSTLVLINGQRLAPSGADGGFVDVSMIPVSAIARIDVLTDSGSAIYGSDAIGGVVNIVLDDRFNGFETAIRTGLATRGGATSMQASQSAGLAWATGSASLNYEYRWQDNLDVGQRSFSATAARPTDLLPSQERHSLFATLSQSIGGLRLFAQSSLSTRDSIRFLNNPRARRQYIFSSSNEQFSGSAGFALPIAAGIKLDGSGAYSRTGTSGERTRRGFGVDSQFDYASELASGNLKIGGEIFDLPGGSVRAALGTEYRHEAFQDRGRGQTFGTAAPHLQRDVTAGFGEIFLPLVGPANSITLVRALRLSAAARYERYSDVGTAFSPRFGVDWSPASGLTLRGSFGRSFRAPLLTDLDVTTKQAILLFLPNPAAPSGETLTLVPASAPVPGLRPEKAKIWSAGVDFEPTFASGLRVSATYFSIDFRDRITIVSGLARAFLDPAFAPIITIQPTASQIADALSGLAFPLENLTDQRPENAGAIFDQRTLNIARTRSEGLDVSVNYKRDIGDASVAISSDASFLFKRDDQLSPTSQTLSVAGTVFNPADFKLRAGLTVARRQASLSVFANHVGSFVDNQRPSLSTKVPSWTTFDLNLSYAFAKNSDVLHGLTAAFSVQNLLDRNPPFVVDLGNSAQSLGYDPSNATPLGRVISISLRKSW
jgi:outer membrane receptor protein involved in Fe transport